jgi:hypothetical protein
MKIYSIFLLLIGMSLSAQKNEYLTVFEKGNGNQTATYQQTIDFYKKLDSDFETIKVAEVGFDDSGEPIRIVTFNVQKQFDLDKIRRDNAILLVNNGIHPGEPDGIDATMMLLRDLATGKRKAPKNTVVVAIPVYNIGGMLNRNSTSRANQDGPEEYGFRGNARNYDLNRDFKKSDTKNKTAFVEIFWLTNPDFFIDNHVSNGADYQYTLTYIMTEHNKLGPVLGQYLDNDMMPKLLASLKKKKIDPTPYVNAWADTPDKGFAQFFESPRFATGYTSLFNTIGFVVETHMLKKYAPRVKATYEFMATAIDYLDEYYTQIRYVAGKNTKYYEPGNAYAIKWETDSSKVEKLHFRGYEGVKKRSEVTNGERLFYDRTKPFDKEIPFYKEYKPIKEIIIPNAYVVPKALWDVVELLKSNGMEFRQIANDTVIEVESYKIANYQTVPGAYEGHYLHRNTSVTKTVEKIKFAKGDYIFPAAQDGVKYLLETLEPESIDSFFNWNFFDTVLQQKEHYSDYVFEDLAAKLLKENPELKKAFDAAMAESKSKENEGDLINVTSLHNNPEAQLDWVYKHSVYYEKAHLQYPVYRILK